MRAVAFPAGAGKRERLAQAATRLGLTRLLESCARRPGLAVLGWHRIGDAAQAAHDPGLYSATADQFYSQIQCLKRRYAVLTLPEALELLRKGRGGPAVLLTFDDGYRDNYSVAFPILRSLGAPATFFLPTSFVGTGRIPWWDAIAWMLRRTHRAAVTLSYPAPLTVSLDDLRAALRCVLNLYKLPTMQDSPRFFAQLAAETGVEPPGPNEEPLFMNWEEVREMVKGGMSFGSHTHTHPVLASVPAERQTAELQASASLLATEAGVTAPALAYPVGKPHSFNEATRSALKNLNYSSAFSFYGGINLPGRTDVYDIRRLCVDDYYSEGSFRLGISAALAPRVMAGAMSAVVR